MSKDPAFLFYSNDFYEGTRTMLPEERACFIDLMIYQHQRGIIPNDIKRVALYCNGISEATLQATLEAKFKLTPEGWVNERLHRVMKERESFSNKQSVNGVVGQFWKKAKAILNSKNFDLLKDTLKNKSNEEIFEEIKNKKINEAMLIAMLKALLKHLEIEIEIENKDIIIEIEKEGVGEKEREDFKEPEIIASLIELSPKSWKEDFNVYLSELNTVYDNLILDQKFIEEQEEFHPGVDVVLSLKKAYTNFWSKESGWKFKKKKRIKTIDWKDTLTNAIGLNKVYKPKSLPTSVRKGTSLSQMQEILDEHSKAQLYGSN